MGALPNNKIPNIIKYYAETMSILRIKAAEFFRVINDKIGLDFSGKLWRMTEYA